MADLQRQFVHGAFTIPVSEAARCVTLIQPQVLKLIYEYFPITYSTTSGSATVTFSMPALGVSILTNLINKGYKPQLSRSTNSAFYPIGFPNQSIEILSIAGNTLTVSAASNSTVTNVVCYFFITSSTEFEDFTHLIDIANPSVPYKVPAGKVLVIAATAIPTAMTYRIGHSSNLLSDDTLARPMRSLNMPADFVSPPYGAVISYSVGSYYIPENKYVIAGVISHTTIFSILGALTFLLMDATEYDISVRS